MPSVSYGPLARLRRGRGIGGAIPRERGGKLAVGRRSVRRVGEVRVAAVDLDPYSRSLALSKANR